MCVRLHGVLGAGIAVLVLGCGDSGNLDSPNPDAASGGKLAAGTGTGSPAGGSAAGATSPGLAGAGSVAWGTAGTTPLPPSAAGSGGAGRGVAGTGSGQAGSVAAAGGGAAGTSGAAGNAAAGAGGTTTGDAPKEHFSFFVTSLDALRKLADNQDGFGGDLRYGESTGLAGADKICGEIADMSMPGASKKGWRAFLSAKAAGPGGAVVHARDRIGAGPWYDRTDRLVAMNLEALLGTRPEANTAIVDNLPNETGAPNRASSDVDNHDTITGSDAQGRYNNAATCDDWTSVMTAAPATGSGGGRPGLSGHNGPMCGHSWPAQSGQSWIAAHPAPGCAPSVSLVQMGAGSGDGIGNGGGYGGFYCFALQP